MEIKKKPEVDLNKQRGLFLSVGFALSVGAMLWLFNYGQKEKEIEGFGQLILADEVAMEIPPTEQIVTPPPPPAPPEIKVVEDEVILEDEPDLKSTEIDEKTAIKIIEAPVRKEVIEEPEIFMIVEDMPLFPGGENAMLKYIGENVRYPQIARENGIQGRVILTFVVDEHGEIRDVKVLRGIGGGCDEEAVRVVKSMPKWKAGKQRGKPVRVQYNLPVMFRLAQ